MSELLTAGEVARQDGDVTPDGVRHWERTGKLVAVARTRRGTRLFDPRDVERFLAERQRRGQ